MDIQVTFGWFADVMFVAFFSGPVKHPMTVFARNLASKGVLEFWSLSSGKLT